MFKLSFAISGEEQQRQSDDQLLDRYYTVSWIIDRDDNVDIRFSRRAPISKS